MFWRWRNLIEPLMMRELIRWDEDFGQIKGKLQKRNSSLSLELNISKKVKGKIKST